MAHEIRLPKQAASSVVNYLPIERIDISEIIVTNIINPTPLNIFLRLPSKFLLFLYFINTNNRAIIAVFNITPAIIFFLIVIIYPAV